MYYPITYPHSPAWLPNVGAWVRQWLTALIPAAIDPVQVQPGDVYHLAAGSYRLQVLTGSVWLPEVGIFTAGQSLTVTVDAVGLAIHTYGQQPVVLMVRGM